MVAWMRSEGGGATFNPMNTTDRMPGSTSYNSAGVQNFRNFHQGLAATLKTLNNGRYGGIIQALRQGRNAYAVAQAVGDSAWGTSGSLMADVLNGMSGVRNRSIVAGGGTGGGPVS